MFLVIEIQTNADNTIGNFVWSFNEEEDAESKWHSVLAVAAKSALPVHSCVILRNDGQQMAAQAYKHGENPEE